MSKKSESKAQAIVVLTLEQILSKNCSSKEFKSLLTSFGEWNRTDILQLYCANCNCTLENLKILIKMLQNNNPIGFHYCCFTALDTALYKRNFSVLEILLKHVNTIPSQFWNTLENIENGQLLVNTVCFIIKNISIDEQYKINIFKIANKDTSGKIWDAINRKRWIVPLEYISNKQFYIEKKLVNEMCDKVLDALGTPENAREIIIEFKEKLTL